MKRLLYVLTGLCLLAGIFAGCEKPNSTREEGDNTASKNYTETAFGMNLEMMYVKGGTFEMGATSEQGSDAYSDEKPVHSVTLNDFYIGATEVTQAQWKAVMGTTLEEQRDKAYLEGAVGNLWGVGGIYPMYYVNWEEAQEFCQKLSETTGKRYILPTEAQWEYAARGGQHADGTKYAGSNTIGDVAWYDANSGEQTHPVGQKKPNGLGLYDMSGNVEEWCSDWYGDYSSSAEVNPQGPSNGSRRVIRDGSWYLDAVDCRVSLRGGGNPGVRDQGLGFRVACLAE
ncbi:MAG: formylglycine-generating enzyme family protein [Bacteroidales bacterium]|nr:formylglycine-generating enzyme family protein [Bacteroidales bacterium]